MKNRITPLLSVNIFLQGLFPVLVFLTITLFTAHPLLKAVQTKIHGPLEDGRTVSARITEALPRTAERTGQHGETLYATETSVTCRYHVQGKERTLQGVLPGTHRTGEETTVIYDPDSPSYARLKNASAPGGDALYLAVFPVAALLLFLADCISWLRTSSLLRRGMLTTARVEYSRQDRIKNDDREGANQQPDAFVTLVYSGTGGEEHRFTVRRKGALPPNARLPMVHRKNRAALLADLPGKPRIQGEHTLSCSLLSFAGNLFFPALFCAVLYVFYSQDIYSLSQLRALF
ncbi:MAG: DUF3592 domain-containing protein [Fibrobacterota bacterium]